MPPPAWGYQEQDHVACPPPPAHGARLQANRTVSRPRLSPLSASGPSHPGGPDGKRTTTLGQGADVPPGYQAAYTDGLILALLGPSYRANRHYSHPRSRGPVASAITPTKGQAPSAPVGRKCHHSLPGSGPLRTPCPELRGEPAYTPRPPPTGKDRLQTRPAHARTTSTPPREARLRA